MRPSLAALALLAGCPGEPQGDDEGGSETSPAATATAVDGTTEATEGRQRAPLVDQTAWAELPAADDPFADHRPTTVSCAVDGAYLEETGFEVDTTLCNYLGRQQPSLVELRAGDRIAIAAFHETLAAVDPGQAHFAVQVGATVVWEAFVDIPASPEVVAAEPFTEELEVDFDAPAGTPVVLHLHNHGFNTWRLLHVDRVPGS